MQKNISNIFYLKKIRHALFTWIFCDLVFASFSYGLLPLLGQLSKICDLPHNSFCTILAVRLQWVFAWIFWTKHVVVMHLVELKDFYVLSMENLKKKKMAWGGWTRKLTSYSNHHSLRGFIGLEMSLEQSLLAILCIISGFKTTNFCSEAHYLEDKCELILNLGVVLKAPALRVASRGSKLRRCTTAKPKVKPQ